jgi:hypothetical protein
MDKKLKFQQFYNTLINEMSVPYSSYVNPESILENKWEEDYDITNDFGEFPTKYGDTVIVKQAISEVNRFFFFINDTLRGLVEYIPLKDNGIKIKETIKVGELGFYMSDVFTDFLLKNFSYIISDSFHTLEGFGVYKRLIKNSNIIFTVFNKKTNDEIIIDSEEELVSYYGKDKANFLYKIKTK